MRDGGPSRQNGHFTPATCSAHVHFTANKPGWSEAGSGGAGGLGLERVAGAARPAAAFHGGGWGGNAEAAGCRADRGAARGAVEGRAVAGGGPVGGGSWAGAGACPG